MYSKIRSVEAVLDTHRCREYAKEEIATALKNAITSTEGLCHTCGKETSRNDIMNILAEKTGIDRTYISRMFNGSMMTNIGNILKIADALDMDTDDLVGREKPYIKYLRQKELALIDLIENTVCTGTNEERDTRAQLIIDYVNELDGKRSFTAYEKSYALLEPESIARLEGYIDRLLEEQEDRLVEAQKEQIPRPKGQKEAK